MSRTDSADPSPLTLEQVLTGSFSVAPADVEKARAYQERYGGRLEKILLNMGVLAEDAIPELYASVYGMAALSEASLQALLDGEDVAPLDNVNNEFLLARQWLPVACEHEVVSFVTADPFSPDVVQYLSLQGIEYQLQVCSDFAFREISTKVMSGRAESELDVVSGEEVDKLRELAAEAPTVNLVNTLIARSLKLRASDLHIEPFMSGYRARVRVDGVLAELDTLPQNMQLAVISRVKILAGMDISEKRRPQDGKISMRVSGQDFDIRVSCLPLNDGESLVLRFLMKQSLSYELGSLGMAADIEERIIADLQTTSGVMLISTETGGLVPPVFLCLITLCIFKPRTRRGRGEHQYAA